MQNNLTQQSIRERERERLIVKERFCTNTKDSCLRKQGFLRELIEKRKQQKKTKKKKKGGGVW